mgnify:CR=1 FL=1
MGRTGYKAKWWRTCHILFYLHIYVFKSQAKCCREFVIAHQRKDNKSPVQLVLFFIYSHPKSICQQLISGIVFLLDKQMIQLRCIHGLRSPASEGQ